MSLSSVWNYTQDTNSSRERTIYELKNIILVDTIFWKLPPEKRDDAYY